MRSGGGRETSGRPWPSRTADDFWLTYEGLLRGTRGYSVVRKPA